MDPAALLRPGLLTGTVIALGGSDGTGGSGGGALGASASGPHAAALTALGARTVALPLTLDEDAALAQAREALAAHGALDVLVHDMRPAFAGGGQDGLRAALDGAWTTLRAVANAAWIEQEAEGRIVLLAPSARTADPRAADARAVDPHAADVHAADPRAADARAVDPRAADVHAADPRAANARAVDPRAGDARATDPNAAAVRAAAENIARTLSIEWSRHGIRSVAISPGPRTTEDELASLTAYLASSAGDYFSGTLLSLGEVAPPAPA